MARTIALFVAISFLVAIPISAEAGAKFGPAKILRIIQWGDDGRLAIDLDTTGIAGTDGCTSPIDRVATNGDTANASSILSVALAAYVAGLEVKVWVSGCTNWQHNGNTYPLIGTITLEQP